MPEINPLAVIAECIEKAKATTDQELINDYIAEALGVLQIDNTEDDAFTCWAVPSSTQSQTTRSIPPVCSRSGPSWRSSGSCRNATGGAYRCRTRSWGQLSLLRSDRGMEEHPRS